MTGQTRLNLESLESRTLLSLTPISPSASYPFSAVVELRATFPDGKSFVGSGALIDRFHVLTAGHVLYSYADGGFASQITATPDLYGTSSPFGSASMTYERTYNAFVNYNKAHPGSTAPGDYDIGLITLNRTLGDSTGAFYFGYDNNNGHFSSSHIMNTAGYPAAGGYDGRHMEFSSGGIAGLSSDGSAIQYYQSNITTYGGQSGSPVWDYNPSTGKRVIYGVHVAGSGTAGSLNFATRITQSIFNDLQNWRQADAVPNSPRAFLPHAAFAQAGRSFRTLASVGAQDGEVGGDAAPIGGEGLATRPAAGADLVGLALDPVLSAGVRQTALVPSAPHDAATLPTQQEGPAPGRDYRTADLSFTWESTHRRQDSTEDALNLSV